NQFPAGPAGEQSHTRNSEPPLRRATRTVCRSRGSATERFERRGRSRLPDRQSKIRKQKGSPIVYVSLQKLPANYIGRPGTLCLDFAYRTWFNMKPGYTFYSEALRIALQAIWSHKLRAFLTLIGIIIGVASVILVGASIVGLNTYVIDRVSRVLGVNHFMIARMANVGRLSEEEWEKRNKRNKRLNLEDFEWVLENCALCQEVGAAVSRSVDLKQNGEEL